MTASSFADPADVAAYRRAIAQGETPAQARKSHDNGVGKWGDDTTSTTTPMCALPRDDWVAKWGPGNQARGKPIRVAYKDNVILCELRDTLPAKKNIKNGVGIDLNPGAVKALGLKPRVKVKNVKWEWASG